MATHTISIYAPSTAPLPLTISDDEGNSASTHDADAALTTEFKVGDSIKFQVEVNPNNAIASIEAINIANLTDSNGNSYNLFTTLPAPDDATKKSWTGVVGSPGVGVNDHYVSPAESYTITFKMSDGNQYTEDPRLKINQ
ncbi:hypothetical protein [Winogradskyella sp. MIT101101]|uniref:hypothetical protein n=1 Tax=Winogradskyella sp. MIT101101 TaxID=3098297 RepID=UPI00399B2124